MLKINKLPLAILTALLLAFQTFGFSQTKKPNIVVIMADDLDSKQLSCYGGQNIKTTNIDLLASQGLKFNQIVASEAMCIPIRASLLTGLYPARHGAHQNHKEINNNLKSVVHFLNDAGYKVGHTGKNHMTTPRSVFPFDSIEGFEPICVSVTDNYFLDSIKTYITKNDKPYCMFIMSNNPHAPFTVGDQKEFDPDKLILPQHWVDTKITRERFSKYLAEVRQLDNQVGDILAMLKETGQDENTIVIFLGEQGAQFPGAKWSLYDNGVLSSMIVKWPKMIKPNSETSAIVQYEDITPTLVEIAGGKIPKGLDGKSFLNVLLGKKDKHRDYAYGIHNNFPEGPPYPIRSIRNSDYKLILNLTPDKKYQIKYMTNLKDKGGVYASWVRNENESNKKLIDRIVTHPEVEFYDLKKDPFEVNNLANDSKYKAQIKKMRKELNKWMVSQGDTGEKMDIPFKH